MISLELHVSLEPIQVMLLNIAPGESDHKEVGKEWCYRNNEEGFFTCPSVQLKIKYIALVQSKF